MKPAQPPVVGSPTVALVTLGCARNDVDSDELAARLEAGGFRVVDEPDGAAAVLVNTCAFVEAAKKDSVDAVLEAAAPTQSGTARAVVAVGCLAERYGRDLAASLTEADAVLGFDEYPDIAARLSGILAGERPASHRPRDRRSLLPLTPVDRQATAAPSLPGHAQSAPDLPSGLAPASGPRALRRRLGSGPMAPLKIASGCDRRCSFCAIPSFRGAFVSRRAEEIVEEARWLAGTGVRELLLVSENSTSYGKDLGDIRLLETLLSDLAGVDGVDRVRVSYLQPAELRPTLVATMAGIGAVASYFDLSFQHASAGVLRRMRRFGDGDQFLELLGRIRSASPTAGVRSNFIVGFPGETERDLQTLCEFLTGAGLDAIGVFGYSDEDGTEAAGLTDHHDQDEVRARVEEVSRLAEELTSQRAEDRIGERVDVLIESIGAGTAEGRAEHQGPEVDGATTVHGLPDASSVGDIVTAVVSATWGADLLATAGVGAVTAAPTA
jgi:ribosomal protein S12 methylthiotransferase